MGSLKLQSYDGEIFEVSIKIAKCSGTIKTMLETSREPDANQIVPLPNVSSTILAKILRWAVHHQDDFEPYEEEYRRFINFSDWDNEFLDVDQGTLFELLQAANYLDIKGLEFIVCRTIADMMKGKTPEQLRETFNVNNDFSRNESSNLEVELPYDDED